MTRYRRYAEYRDPGVEWINEIPQHWSRAPVKHVLTTPITDGPHETPTFVADGIEFLSVDGIQDGELVFQGKRYISYADHARYSAKAKPQLNDILVGKSASVGKVARVKTPIEFNVWSPLAILRPNPNKCLPAFLEYVFKSDICQQQMTLAGNTSTQANIGMDRLASIGITLPPLQEQAAIAAAIDRETARIDALIARKTRFIALLQEKRQALITHAVTKGLDPNVKMKDSGVEWIGRVPEHWDVMPIRMAAKLESGHTPSRNHPEYWVDCTVPWFSLADVWQIRSGDVEYVEETKEKVSELGLANSSARLHPAGTVILSRTASVGFSAIMAIDMATTQDFADWICGPRLIPEFLLYVFRSMRQEFQWLVIGSTHMTIYMPDIEAFRFALPPRAEQDRIVREGLHNSPPDRPDVRQSSHETDQPRKQPV